MLLTDSLPAIAIVGGGIGGMECALVLKKRGHTPVIYEKSGKLGGMYNYASAMSFKEADKKLLEWYDRELKKAGIEMNRKSLSELAITDAAAFGALVETAKKAL